HDERLRALCAFAGEFPQLVTIETIGTSREGRPIPPATVTHRVTGAAADKPAFWMDGTSTPWSSPAPRPAGTCSTG
ncbi:MAG: M14 family zinc carboxypeptidase, partial [Elioraea sp.]|nr:M14 family zinc carboxypeptidase [Elioraea sp.]